MIVNIILLHVKVNFLPVGHTHEDVDQFFSRVSTHLSRTGAESIRGQAFSSYTASSWNICDMIHMYMYIYIHTYHSNICAVCSIATYT